jgi:hypothetical protein
VNWRDVPEPDTLEHVLRSAGGLPVPYVAAWSSENDRQIVRPCPLVQGKPAFFSGGRRGDGDPVFGEMEPSRQRHCVIKRRCQVCNGRASEQLLVDGRGTSHSTLVGGAWLKVVLEPWVCAPCLVYALRVCPGLVTKSAYQQIQILEVRRAVPVAVLTRHPDGRVAYGYIKIGVHQADEHDPIAWLSQHMVAA